MQTLPPVGRIQGVELRSAPTHQGSVVSVQYSTHSKEGIGDYELVIPFLDAMYLLNVLRDLEKQTAFEGPQRP